MKLLKMAVAIAFAATFGSAYAFHDGGVATCESCHTMHNSSAKETGALAPQMTNNNVGVNNNTNPYLLQGQDASSTCLACHGASTPGSYHVLDTNAAVAGNLPLNTTNFTPGGEFGWLQVSGRKGHSVYAADYTATLPANETRHVPPGYTGAWTGTDFSCVSCHDPHGQSRWTSATAQDRQNATAAGGAIVNAALLPISASGSYGGSKYAEYDGVETVGAYRLLGGNGWKPRTSPNQPALVNSPPVALAPGTYNASETSFALNAAGHTGQTVVAYLSGMSEWCGNCHPGMHGQAATGFAAQELKHPSGPTATLGALAGNYVKYVKTGDLTGTAAYDALIPVELNIPRNAAAAALSTDTTGTSAIAGQVTATASVMCLTCHRAHASAFDSMMRWEVTSLDDIGSTGALTNTQGGHNATLGYYARAATQAAPQYGTEQRMLCNKCHVKD